MLRWSAAQWGVLVVLALLVGASWWLDRMPEGGGGASGLDVPGGFEARGINVAQYMAGGALQYRLLAPRMQQYGDGKPTVLNQPALEHFGEKDLVTQFNAPLAHWYEDNNILQFPKDLTVTRPAGNQSLPLWFNAADVIVDNNKQTLVGKGVVKARYGASTMDAVGVEYNWQQRQLVLKSKVRMVYVKPR